MEHKSDKDTLVNTHSSLFTLLRLWTSSRVPLAMPERGVKSFWSGSTYDGEILNGKRHGRGTKHWPNGDVYEGACSPDRSTAGQPIPQPRAGYMYVLYNVVLIPWAVCVAAGEWQFDKKDGRGKMTVAKASYEGEWSAGKKHGKGTAKFTNGGRYEGEWASDRYACVERERVCVCRACTLTRGKAHI